MKSRTDNSKCHVHFVSLSTSSEEVSYNSTSTLGIFQNGPLESQLRLAQCSLPFPCPDSTGTLLVKGSLTSAGMAKSPEVWSVTDVAEYFHSTADCGEYGTTLAEQVSKHNFFLYPHCLWEKLFFAIRPSMMPFFCQIFASHLQDLSGYICLQEIDGKALLLLTPDTLQKYMGLRLGPALKICSHITNLKTRWNIC